jgi:hypothetical protein
MLLEQSVAFTARVMFVFKAELISKVGFAAWNFASVFSLARPRT